MFLDFRRAVVDQAPAEFFDRFGVLLLPLKLRPFVGEALRALPEQGFELHGVLLEFLVRHDREALPVSGQRVVILAAALERSSFVPELRGQVLLERGRRDGLLLRRRGRVAGIGRRRLLIRREFRFGPDVRRGDVLGLSFGFGDFRRFRRAVGVSVLRIPRGAPRVPNDCDGLVPVRRPFGKERQRQFARFLRIEIRGCGVFRPFPLENDRPRSDFFRVSRPVERNAFDGPAAGDAPARRRGPEEPQRSRFRIRFDAAVENLRLVASDVDLHGRVPAADFVRSRGHRPRERNRDGARSVVAERDLA